MPPLLPADLNERIIADRTQCIVVGWNPPSTGRIIIEKKIEKASTHTYCPYTIFIDQPNSPLLFKSIQLLNRNAVCNSQANFNGRVRESMMCAGSAINSEGAMCSSTRGGGLYCNNLFVGVASFGFGCGVQPYTPGVYTQVFFFRINFPIFIVITLCYQGSNV